MSDEDYDAGSLSDDEDSVGAASSGSSDDGNVDPVMPQPTNIKVLEPHEGILGEMVKSSIVEVIALGKRVERALAAAECDHVV
jgi:hypothetical protein